MKKTQTRRKNIEKIPTKLNLKNLKKTRTSGSQNIKRQENMKNKMPKKKKARLERLGRFEYQMRMRERKDQIFRISSSED